MINHILIWDNDGTIMGSQDPNDPNKVILPHVQATMSHPHTLNIICSGCKTPTSELQNFNPTQIVQRLTSLMTTLPITAATFSPTIGGVECFVLIKEEDGSFTVHKAHEEERYKQLVGSFKKPGTGMLLVIKDLLQEKFGLSINASTTRMIGDTWHDKEAATAVGIPFVDAKAIHEGKNLFRLTLEQRKY